MENRNASAERAAGDLVSIAAPDFSLDLTLGCGQVFHWERDASGYIGTVGDHALYVEQQGDVLLVPKGLEDLARHYFALDHPLPEIYATFPTDPAMQEALAFCRGLRLVRQPLWECVATFITSSMKQVAHIAQMSRAIRSRFGAQTEWNGRKLFAYPPPERLAELDESELRACSLGYRAKNLLGSARMIASGEVNLEAISQMSDAEALTELCRLPGVGVKVANCALLFAFERPRAFPIDVWIERVLREMYFHGKRRLTPARLREFSETYFGAYSGYAQQYLFHHARLTWKANKASLPSTKGAKGRKPSKVSTASKKPGRKRSRRVTPSSGAAL
jgi:N-glycosylase/DNA lyase